MFYRIRLFVFVLMINIFFFNNLFASDKVSNFSSSGIIELEAAAYFTYSETYYPDWGREDENFDFHLDPIINYYIFDNIHLGLIIGFGYNKYSIEYDDDCPSYSGHSYSLRPGIKFGYTFNVSNNLFFDFSIKYSYTHLEIDSSSENGHKTYNTISFEPVFKYDTGNGLINIGPSFLYRKRKTMEQKSITFFRLGYSVYF